MAASATRTIPPPQPPAVPPHSYTLGMRRIVVAGPSGAGKSTLAAKIAGVQEIPYRELDALYDGPHWTKNADFEETLDRFTSQSAWVTEWQYDSAKPVLLERADTFVWLDLPFPLILWRVTMRTIRRALTHEELWGGNHEPPLHKILTDQSNMIRWSITSRNHVRDVLPGIIQNHPDLHVIRLRSRRQVRELLKALSSPGLTPNRTHIRQAPSASPTPVQNSPSTRP